jgi:serine phosphatase RsbU (regulator of sigma subunit)
MSSNDSAGPPLGLFDNAQYRTCSYPMAVDDFIMLFTDGLYEVQAPDDEIYGRDRFIAAVRELVRLPSAELLVELFAQIRQFSKRTKFSDDVCLVGMDVTRLRNKDE